MADNTILNTGSGGDTIGSDDISSVKYQRIKLIHGADGVNAGDVSSVNGLPVQIEESDTYQWIVPSTAVGANKIFLDLFNGAGSGKVIKIRAILPIIDTDVAVVGVVGIRVIVVRTSTVGTGGTAWVKNGAVDVAGGAWAALDTSNADIGANITARHLSTAGATTHAWMRGAYLMGEEASTSLAYNFQGQYDMAGDVSGCQPIILREGFGIKIYQGAVASAGNIRFRILFTLV